MSLLRYFRHLVLQDGYIGTLVESVECGIRMWKFRSLVPSRVKLMTYKIDTCRFLSWRSALIGQGKDLLAQYQDNVTEWEITA